MCAIEIERIRAKGHSSVNSPNSELQFDSQQQVQQPSQSRCQIYPISTQRAPNIKMDPSTQQVPTTTWAGFFFQNPALNGQKALVNHSEGFNICAEEKVVPSYHDEFSNRTRGEYDTLRMHMADEMALKPPAIDLANNFVKLAGMGKDFALPFHANPPEHMQQCCFQNDEYSTVAYETTSPQRMLSKKGLDLKLSNDLNNMQKGNLGESSLAVLRTFHVGFIR